jgi:hypothetical protein
MPRTLTDSDRAAVAQNIRHAKIVEAGRKLARIVKTEHPSPASLKRRKRLEPHLDQWLKYYMPDTFPDAWGASRLDFIATLQRCIKYGGSFALALPRGGGKSAVAKGACVYAALTGQRKYLVPMGATDSLASEYLDFIKNQIDGSNPYIAEDYPEAVVFFKALDWKAIKGPHQLDGKGRKTGISWRSHGVTFPTIYKPDEKTLYPFSGSRIECRGITAAMKGMAKTVGGKIIRPDFVLPDDVQTEDDAQSMIACKKIENKITGTVLALAGPRSQIACFMPCTVVERDDVSCRFLDRKRHPDFQGKKYPMIISWPKAQDTLWKQYANIRSDADTQFEGKRLATAFYLAHREEMDAGSVTSCDSRVRKGETSAIETAENLLIEMGREKFDAEMQQEPPSSAGSLYDLDAPTICQHISPLPRLHIPPAANFLVGMIDINPRAGGLHWAMAAFDQTMTGHCPAYGKWPEHGNMVEKNASEQAIQVAIFRCLKELCDRIQETVFIRGGLRITPNMILVDVGYMGDAVQRFAQQARYSFRVVPSIGRDSKSYRVKNDTLIGRPFENCHVQRAQKIGHGPYVMFHADYWRETMQRAFLGVAGERGGFTLYQPDSHGAHSAFAEQVCAEKLAHKGDIGGGLRWEWTRQPGASWDWGDCLTGCWVAAAASGLSASGHPAPAPAPMRNMRQVRHIAI